ncbi:hypothetical protein [Stenotrophomonas pavanii]|uniref:hypothetical protein n=1 Tax=Stenotrophomonas pavanii TaxID=487698 RepID=UPI0039C67A5E
MKYLIGFAPALLLSLAAGCSTAQDDGAKRGLLNCMSAIQAASAEPSRTKVPYVKDMGSANEHYFAWPAGAGLVFSETGGSTNPASASCVTNAEGTVTDMTINGSEIPIP